MAFETKDPRGYNIKCTDDCWNNHIVAEHAELKGHEGDGQKLLASPLIIYQSSASLKREVYYGLSSDLPSPFERGYVRVVVEFRTNWRRQRMGYVVTAFHVLGPKQGETPIWP